MQAQRRSRVAAGTKWQQEQGRSKSETGAWPEQGISKPGASYFRPILAPRQYFMGRSRAESEQGQSESRTGAG